MNLFNKHAHTFLMLGFTAVFIGYLTVWMPGPAAGLRLLGVEMGEWFKFLGLGPRRDLFYLPPIALGLCLALWTMTWPQDSWRAWLMRILAVGVSLLAFPAIEDITNADATVREQYYLRVVLIGLVIIVALLSGFWRPLGKWRLVPWLLMVVVSLIGLVLPTWQYMQIRPYTSQVMGISIGVGEGVWLNGVGFSAIFAVSVFKASMIKRTPKPVTTNYEA